MGILKYILHPAQAQMEINDQVAKKKIDNETKLYRRKKLIDAAEEKQKAQSIDPWDQFMAEQYFRENPNVDTSVPEFKKIRDSVVTKIQQRSAQQTQKSAEIPQQVSDMSRSYMNSYIDPYMAAKLAIQDRIDNAEKRQNPLAKPSKQEKSQAQQSNIAQPMFNGNRVVFGKNGFEFKEPMNMDNLALEAAKLGVQVEPTDTQQSVIKKIAAAKSGENYTAELPQLEPSATPEEKQGFLMQLEPADRALVEGITNYKLDISRVTSLKGGARERIASLAARFDPEFDMMQYGARKKFMEKYTAGTLQDNRVSLNTAIRHIGTLAEKLQKLDNLKQPFINAVINPIEYQMGKKEITGVRASMLAVSNELAKAFKGTGVTAEKEIEEFKKAISQNASPEQQHEFLTTFLDLLDGRIQEVNNEYVRAMGKEPDQLLSPAAVLTLQKIQSMYDGGDVQQENIDSNIPQYDQATEKLQRRKNEDGSYEYRVVPK